MYKCLDVLLKVWNNQLNNLKIIKNKKTTYDSVFCSKTSSDKVCTISMTFVTSSGAGYNFSSVFRINEFTYALETCTKH